MNQIVNFHKLIIFKDFGVGLLDYFNLLIINNLHLNLKVKMIPKNLYKKEFKIILKNNKQLFKMFQDLKLLQKINILESLFYLLLYLMQ